LLTAGTYGGWRSRRISGGLVASVGAHLVAWSCVVCWWAFTTYPFARSQQHDPYWIRAWQGSAAPGESFMHWIVWDNVGATIVGGTALLIRALALGLAGGAVGRLLPPRKLSLGVVPVLAVLRNRQIVKSSNC
jgi:hypothetical protein